MKLYPLKFHPIFVDKLWGGDRLRNVLHKDCSDQCGESWEISAVKGSVSRVSEGALEGKDLQSLIDEYQGELVGNRIYSKYGSEFPLLIKFLDANDDLSVQVHPNDEQAMQKHGTRGKTEMWYVLEADEDATLIAGLNEGIDAEKYQTLFDEGRIMEALRVEKVDNGDIFFIPAGKVHTIGKGILLAEVQETSDITYRIYDFDRIDINGTKRELHVQDALEVINFNDDPESKVDYPRDESSLNLVTCEHFTTNKISASEREEKDYSGLDSFVIYICTNGGMNLIYDEGEIKLGKGQSVLIPASMSSLAVEPDGSVEYLEVYIEE